MIKHFSYKYILYLFLLTFLIPSDYKTLYLMEFENTARDPRTDYLRFGLPEIVRMKYSNDSKMIIEYTPASISITDEQISKLSDGILLYGNFNTIHSDIVISFNIYDVDTWEERSNRSFKCNINDLECIENAFHICVEEELMSYFCDYVDCLGVCEGDAKMDCMGTCQGDAKKDCKGICNGSNSLDQCGTCDSTTQNDCIQDCNGDWGGSAYINDCKVCVSGETGRKYDHALDCNGICFGESKLDCNGVCGGDATADCQGICEGLAFLNECNVCIDGETGNDTEAGKDCMGICFGGAIVDECDVCNGFNSSCSDCFGVPFGPAQLDDCGVCDDNPLNDCKQDCNGDWGGEAYINDCLVCVGGNTGNELSNGIDCNGDCWGDAILDECGVCNGPGAIYECGCENINEGKCDCHGNSLDICGICGGDGKDIDNDGICDAFDDFIGVSKQKEKKLNFNLNEDTNSVELFDLNNENNNSIDLFNNNKSYDKKENTQTLYNLIDQKLVESYQVNIDIENIDYKYNNNTVDVMIPVHYSIKHEMFKDVFKNFNYNIIDNQNSTITIQLIKNNFLITSQFEEYCSLMKYQLVPVLFFTNDEGKIKHIHIDSWNSYNLNQIGKDIDVTYSNQFSTMFSITTGAEHLYFNFELKEVGQFYNFSFPKNELEDYSKFFIKFLFEDNLEVNLLSYSMR